jgi:predicted MFS family arabinose efflux permease
VPFSERRILLLLGAVQFVNVIDFMMVMPLGPTFAAHLGIPTGELGWVAGGYTAAAAGAGLVGTLFLDRFDRRRALFVAMMGLALSTAAGGLASGLGSMLAARVLAGAFGGPATALAMAIVADVVPIERRGQALGKVAGAFAVASVVGVPAGLELARLGGWRLPFFAVAGLGFVVALGANALMPPLRGHLTSHGRQPQSARPLGEFLGDPTVLLGLSSMAILMTGTFALVANLPSYLIYNLGYPATAFSALYMVGGAASFFAMRAAGRLIDRRGVVAVATGATVLSSLAIAMLFFPARPPLPVLLLFPALMVANATRVVSLNALSSRVPAPSERARYMSAQSAVQHIATSLGAIASTWLLHERPDHALSGVPRLAIVAIVLAAPLPLLLARLTARVRARELAAAPAPAG